MALSRQKKIETVTEIADLLARSKMTVFAGYGGTSVRAMQELRALGKESDTRFKVVKNRLFKRALAESEGFKGLDMAKVHGQLIYGFSESDEVAPAQALANFARTNPQIELFGAITAEGQLLSTEDVKSLATLPSKDQLRAQLTATINSPAGSLVGILMANLRGFTAVLNSRSNNLTG